MTKDQQLILDRQRDLVIEEIDEALHRLAQAGLGPYDGAKFLLDRVGMSLREAKRRVHSSGAWRHLNKEIEQLHDDLEAALDAELASRSK